MLHSCRDCLSRLLGSCGWDADWVRQDLGLMPFSQVLLHEREESHCDRAQSETEGIDNRTDWSRWSGHFSSHTGVVLWVLTKGWNHHRERIWRTYLRVSIHGNSNRHLRPVVVDESTSDFLQRNNSQVYGTHHSRCTWLVRIIVFQEWLRDYEWSEQHHTWNR